MYVCMYWAVVINAIVLFCVYICFHRRLNVCLNIWLRIVFLFYLFIIYYWLTSFSVCEVVYYMYTCNVYLWDMKEELHWPRMYIVYVNIVCICIASMICSSFSVCMYLYVYVCIYRFMYVLCADVRYDYSLFCIIIHCVSVVVILKCMYELFMIVVCYVSSYCIMLELRVYIWIKIVYILYLY